MANKQFLFQKFLNSSIIFYFKTYGSFTLITIAPWVAMHHCHHSFYFWKQCSKDVCQITLSSPVVFITMSSAIWNISPFGSFLFWGTYGGGQVTLIGGCRRTETKCYAKNSLLSILCELVYCGHGGAGFLQSTFQVFSLYQTPQMSPNFKIISLTNHLAHSNEPTMNNANILEKMINNVSTFGCTCCAFLGHGESQLCHSDDCHFVLTSHKQSKATFPANTFLKKFLNSLAAGNLQKLKHTEFSDLQSTVLAHLTMTQCSALRYCKMWQDSTSYDIKKSFLSSI
jgi:hypothetical protein